MLKKFVTFVVVIVVINIVLAADDDRLAKTLKNENVINPDGTYKYEYETSNQISAKEEGIGGVIAKGEAKWISKEGEPIQFSYTADEYGYHPEGSHIPPVPAYVIKLVQWLKDHPYSGEGAYNPETDN